jgi:dipeptidyl aminopeptidase/acylaminoacyl peptidase
MIQAKPLAMRLIFAATAAFFCAAAPAVAAQAGAKPSIDSFFQNATMSQVSLSPDGRHLGMLVAREDGRVQLATLEIGAAASVVVAAFSDADVRSFRWVNNNRLVLDTMDRQEGPGNNHHGPGLFAVNRDGSELLTLIRRSDSSGDRGALSAWYRFHSVAGDADTDEVYVTGTKVTNRVEFEAQTLVRLNTVTRRFTTIERPGKTVQWLMDNQGQPRLVMTRDKTTAAVLYRDPTNNAWRKLAEFDIFGHDGFAPIEFGPDGKLYVSARLGNDKQAIYTYDLEKNRINPVPVAALTNYDMTGRLINGAHAVLGVRYVAASPNTFWFDDKLRALQKTINGLLPGTVNQLDVAPRSEGTHVLVHSSSDTLPGRYYLYNTLTAKLNLVGDAQPQIDPNRMAPKEMVRYKARDGLEIPAYLTLPQGTDGKNLPMVVLVHGGPYLRGDAWLWNPEVQFLASRGYAVLQPEYRGSTGFGEKHFRAGWKQWGLKMQDDIADGTQWAIQQGIADPKRICIAGASYGGYATLMGLVNNPELYRCGVNWVGVTDIELMYSEPWSDASEASKLYSMPVLIGDREKDAAQLKATSPIEQASRIKQPLLLAYGGADRRVPIVHGTKFRDAVKAYNPDVEWISYNEEGHGWALVKNRVDFWQHVEAFLDKNIGPSARPASATVQQAAK